jgi:acylphosphatase
VSVRLHAIISGHVQGVGYRYFVQQHARRLGLNGFVRNMGSSQVEVIAQGPRPDLDDLLAMLYEGPSAADVTNVQASWGEPQDGLDSFKVRSSA